MIWFSKEVGAEAEVEAEAVAGEEAREEGSKKSTNSRCQRATKS